MERNIDIELFVGILSAALFVFLIFLFTILFFFRYRKRKFQNKQYIENLKLEFSQTLLQSQVEIQEQTLLHFSKELHDNLGQIASLIKINLNTLSLNDLDRAEKKVEDTKVLIKQLISDLKTLSISLNSERIQEIGLFKALETEIERIEKTGLFTTTFKKASNIPDIESEKAIIIYRMAQEVLNNTLKHSQATHITLLCSHNENSTILAFSDNGIGFNIDESQKSGGAGIKNLKKRASLIKALLSIHSSTENGTQIFIELPL